MRDDPRYWISTFDSDLAVCSVWTGAALDFATIGPSGPTAWASQLR